ncbi:hypothetical protein V0R55_05170 [Pseudomonas soli]|uniref:Uncharacterized protein n=1 Tax=Pseudomonas soli TaxID=1306993 RepID=A0ABU7GMQ8_9PSED|nr:hypothetical protein [Pseudomonas soli]MEE1879541.1 hypothetical protein [Pseudomonas soli]
MLINGYQSYQYLPTHIRQQTHSWTVGEVQVRSVITSPEADRLAKRIEYNSDRGLLQHLKVSRTQPLTDLFRWLVSCLGVRRAAQRASDDLPLQYAEQAGTAALFRCSFGNGFKTVLEAVSLLATAASVDHQRFDVTLEAEQINCLRDAMVEGHANFKAIEMMVKTRGDLQCVRSLALSLMRKAEDCQPSIEAALANVATDRPDPSVFLNGLMTFLQGQEARWFEKTMNNPKLRIDAQAQNDFISEKLQEHIDTLDALEADKMLEQLEGIFGKRASGVMGFANELLGLADEDDQLLSRMTRAESLSDSLVDLLRAKLDRPEKGRAGSPTIKSFNELNPLELAALVSLGVKLQ